jgi:hypothetical protein
MLKDPARRNSEMTWLTLTRPTGEEIYVNMDNVVDFAPVDHGPETVLTTLAVEVSGPLMLRVTESPEFIAQRLSIHGGKSHD